MRRIDDVSTGEVARKLDQHIEECRERTIEFKQQLSDHQDNVQEKHNENLARFARLERVIYIAMGVGLTLGALGNHINLARIFN